MEEIREEYCMWWSGVSEDIMAQAVVTCNSKPRLYKQYYKTLK